MERPRLKFLVGKWLPNIVLGCTSQMCKINSPIQNLSKMKQNTQNKPNQESIASSDTAKQTPQRVAKKRASGKVTRPDQHDHCRLWGMALALKQAKGSFDPDHTMHVSFCGKVCYIAELTGSSAAFVRSLADSYPDVVIFAWLPVVVAEALSDKTIRIRHIRGVMH